MKKAPLTVASAHAGFFLGLLGACTSHPSFEKTPLVHSVQDAATIRVTALSIARWEDYVDALQPQFTITSDAAAALALPQTSISQTSLADSLGLGLQVGLPQTTHTQSVGQSGNQGTSTTATSATNQGATTNSSSTTTNSGASNTNTSAATLAPGVAPASTLTALAAPSSTGIAGPTGTLQVDPIDSYGAASAIFEEVQLLNRVLEDGALRYGYVPYVARMQISVMPFARNEPFDVYLDVGLFSTCNGFGSDQVAPAIVVPLLVTDDVEKGQASNASNLQRQLALSLAGVVQNVGFSGNFSKLSDNFKSVLAETFNNRFMVSRGAENVLEVRVGAAASAVTKVGFTMEAQTHNLSFLLLVKREHAAIPGGVCSPDPAMLHRARLHGTGVESGPVVEVTTLARLKNAKSGVELPSDGFMRLKKAREVAKVFPGHLPDRTVDRLIQDVNGLDEKQFQTDLPADLRVFWPTLWTGLTSVLSLSEYNATSFNLPYRRSPPQGLESQAAIIHDNCKDTASASLIGFNDAVAGQFFATLELSDGTYSMAATSVVQSTPGGPLALTLPSLNTLSRVSDDIKAACPSGVAPPPAPRRVSGARLVVRRLVDDRWMSPEEREEAPAGGCLEQCVFHFNTVLLDSTPQVSQTVGLLSAADSIVADTATGNGKMRLLVTIGKDLDSVKVSLNGALLTPTTPTVSSAATISLLGGGFSITPAATAAADASASTTPLAVDMSLQGLVAGRAITITAVGQKNKKATTVAPSVVVVPIVSPPTSVKTTSATPTI